MRGAGRLKMLKAFLNTACRTLALVCLRSVNNDNLLLWIKCGIRRIVLNFSKVIVQLWNLKIIFTNDILLYCVLFYYDLLYYVFLLILLLLLLPITYYYLKMRNRFCIEWLKCRPKNTPMKNAFFGEFGFSWEILQFNSNF